MTSAFLPTDTPKTLTDSAYAQLRADIIQGKLAPDSKLKIDYLSKNYGVGATPIREALSRLSSDGFVVNEGQRGFNVAPVSIDDLQDVTEMRLMLELKALRKSIINGDEAWESQVVAAYYQLSKTEALGIAEHIDTWDQRNSEFHWALISACSSRWLLRFFRILYDQHKRYRNISLTATRNQRNVHQEHERIYTAALARDVDTVCAETEKHIRTTADITQKILRKQLEDSASTS